MSNGLDPDQARHFVGPDLGSNCFQRLSADNNSRLSPKNWDTNTATLIPFYCNGIYGYDGPEDPKVAHLSFTSPFKDHNMKLHAKALVTIIYL